MGDLPFNQGLDVRERVIVGLLRPAIDKVQVVIESMMMSMFEGLEDVFSFLFATAQRDEMIVELLYTDADTRDTGFLEGLKFILLRKELWDSFKCDFTAFF